MIPTVAVEFLGVLLVVLLARFAGLRWTAVTGAWRRLGRRHGWVIACSAGLTLVAVLDIRVGR